MDTQSESRKRIPEARVHSICNNFNYRAKRKPVVLQIPQRWGEAAVKAVQRITKNVEKTETVLKKSKDLPGWSATRQQAEQVINKVSVKFEGSWYETSFRVLERLNNWPESREIEQDDLWKVCAYWETSRLNRAAQHSVIRETVPSSWHNAYSRSVYSMKSGGAEFLGRQFEEWDWVFRIITRSWGRSRRKGWERTIQKIKDKATEI